MWNVTARLLARNLKRQDLEGDYAIEGKTLQSKRHGQGAGVALVALWCPDTAIQPLKMTKPLLVPQRRMFSGCREKPEFHDTDCFEKRNGEWKLIHQHASVPAGGDWDGKITATYLKVEDSKDRKDRALQTETEKGNCHVQNMVGDRFRKRIGPQHC